MVKRANETLMRVHHNLSTLAWHTSELASQTRALQEQLKRSLEIQHNRIASRMCVPAARFKQEPGLRRCRSNPGTTLDVRCIP